MLFLLNISFEYFVYLFMLLLLDIISCFWIFGGWISLFFLILMFVGFSFCVIRMFDMLQLLIQNFVMLVFILCYQNVFTQIKIQGELHYAFYDGCFFCIFCLFLYAFATRYIFSFWIFGCWISLVFLVLLLVGFSFCVIRMFDILQLLI